jgi:tetratricopeptide (TPR) repeat protein
VAATIHKGKEYETTVVDFVAKDGGRFLVVSEDRSFSRAFRTAVVKELEIEEEAITSPISDQHVLKYVEDMGGAETKLIVFLERILNHKETIPIIKKIKQQHPDVKIIILTGETDQSKLIFLHELGVENFICKPVSVNSLIEKIASTIRPQGKIGRLIEIGRRLIMAGEYQRALEACGDILDLKPNSAAAYMLLGDAYLGLGEKDRAVQEYEQASRFARLYLEPLKKLSQLHSEEGKIEKQLSYLERLDALSPLNVERKIDIGGIHVELGNEEKAEQYFDLAVKQATKVTLDYIKDISLKIADIYVDKDPERAEKYYRGALDVKRGMLDESDLETFNRLGINLRRQGKWEEAIAEYKKALRISPKDEGLYFNTAMAQAEGKSFEDSAESLRKALKLNPEFHKTDPLLCNHIGTIFVKVGAYKEAREFLQEALRLDPNFQQPKKLLASLPPK